MASEFVLTDDDMENIVIRDGTEVYFCSASISACRDTSKLRDSHVIGLLDNPDHVDKQKVEVIILTDCRGITDDSLVFIADNFPQLKELFVQGCDITDKGIIAVTEKSNKLTDLNYSGCSKVTNAALEAIVSNLPQLQELYAGNCNISVIPDDFGHKLEHLQELNLSNNNITTLPASICKLSYLQDLCLAGNKIKTLPASIGKFKFLSKLDLSDNNITMLPESIGELEHLEILILEKNNITTLPLSIANLAGTCTYFFIAENPLSKPLEDLAHWCEGDLLEDIKQYFETQKTLQEAAGTNTHNDEILESPNGEEESTLTLTTHTGEVNEATASSDTEPLFAPITQTNVNYNSTSTSSNNVADADADADAALLVDSSTNNDNSASSLGKRSRQEQHDTTSTTGDIPVSTVTTERTMPDGQQQIVVIKREPLLDPTDSQTTSTKDNDAFDQHDYNILRTHYLKPKVRQNEEIPSGMQLRRRYAPAVIDGKTEGYKELKRQINKLEKDNDDKEIYRLLKGLRRFEVERTPISSFIRGDNDGDNEVKEILDLTGIPDDDDVIDVDSFIIDFLLVEVIKPDPDAVPPSGGTNELSSQQQQELMSKRKVKADPDADA